MSRFIIRTVLSSLMILLLLAQAGFARALSVDSVNFSQQAETIHLTLKLNKDSDFRAFVLPDPYRLVVDLPRFDWRAQEISRPKNFIVSDIRQGPLQDDMSRIVFDMREPVQIQNAALENGNLKLQFSKASKNEFKAQSEKVFGELLSDKSISTDMQKVLSNLHNDEGFLKPTSVLTNPVSTKNLPPAQKPPEENKEENTKSVNLPLIVIDPGHGGVDPGAISANNLKEKDIVLALAKDLKKILEDSGRYTVALTRESDKFIPLRDRVSFARDNGADLFISIHADSIHRSDVRGSSVYTLSKEASDAQTAKLAERENSADLIGGIDLEVEDEQVAFILGDFLMTETLNQSKFFANTLVERMKSNGVSVLDNSHRYAGFAVLKAPDIPSVLVEAGFMSNKNEARLLTQQEHRKKITTALKAGIDSYFNQLALKGGP